MEEPLVSVIIPTYNSAQYIKEALDSVFNQTYKNLEVIVVDDGSTDNTKEVLKPYLDRIQYIYKENGGPASARNMGIKHSKGEYIAFLDADDVWLPEKLEKQIKVFQNYPFVGLIHTNANFVGQAVRAYSKDNSVSVKEVFKDLFWHNFIKTSTVAVKKECLSKLELFEEDKNFLFVEDYDMWLRIALKYKVGYIDEILVSYRRHNEQHSRKTENIDLMYRNEKFVIEKMIKHYPEMRNKIDRSLDDRFVKLFYEWGREHYSVKNFKLARNKIRVSLKYRLLNPDCWKLYLFTLLKSSLFFIKAFKIQTSLSFSKKLNCRVLKNFQYLIPRPKICYLGWIGHNNLGDEAIYYAFKKLFPELVIISTSLSKKVYWAEKILKKKLFKATFLGGGTLINNEEWLKLFRKAQNKYQPSFVLGSGVRNPVFWDSYTKNKNCLIEWVERLSKCSFVGVRGPLSKEILKSKGLNNVEIVGDTALILGKTESRLKSGNKRIGINISITEKKWGDSKKLLNSFFDLIKILKNKGYKIEFLPVCPNDVLVYHDIIKKCGSEISIFRNYLSIEKTMQFLETCDLFIGTRLHSVVLAMCTVTPSLMFEYQPKCLDFMLSMELEKFNIRTDRLNVEYIISLADLLIDNLSYYQEKIVNKLRYYQQILQQKRDYILTAINQY